ncbi:helix-turn-helix domain-containing protein [Streptomyces sp. NPDC087263]|uniref:helix-turn-helix domain-containing protein n=1 Tax=Streptomyces sp. NPDC087263 TaxID=3365773 RepID=UPI00381D76F7
MRELAGRLAELDPDAGAALQAIAYFDRLMEGRVGLEALVRGAAVLSGYPARLVDERRGVRIRVEPNGRREDSGGPVDPAWPWVPLDASEVRRPWTSPDTPGAAPARAQIDTSGAGGRPRGRAGTPEAAPAAASLDAPYAAPLGVSLDASGVVGPGVRAGASEAASVSSSLDAPYAAPLGASLDTSGVVAPGVRAGTPEAAPAAASFDAPYAAPPGVSLDTSGVVGPGVRAGNSEVASAPESFDASDVASPGVSLDASGAVRPQGRMDAQASDSLDAPHATPPRVPHDAPGVVGTGVRVGTSEATSGSASFSTPHAAPPGEPLDASGVAGLRVRAVTPEAAASAAASLEAPHATPPGVPLDTFGVAGTPEQAGTSQAASEATSLEIPRSAPARALLDSSGAAPVTVGSPVTASHADVPGPESAAALWLELPGSPDGVRAMILERAAGAVRAVLERTRGWAPPAAPASDPALVEVVLDASAPDATRTHAAAQLGLKRGQSVRAVALEGGGAEIVPAGRPGSEARRAGVGPAVEPAELPRSWAAARTALRFTAGGTAHDPGPRTVYADELGGLALLAAAVGPDTPPIPDELALERALAEASWAAATLHAVASTPSLRAAAAELTVHHSTLQERLVQAEHILGWDVHPPQGRLRLQLALAVRKLRRTGAAGQASGGFSGDARR